MKVKNSIEEKRNTMLDEEAMVEIEDDEHARVVSSDKNLRAASLYFDFGGGSPAVV